MLLVLLGMVVESALGWSIVWPALAVAVAGLAVLAVALMRWGTSRAWTNRHVTALVVGVLLSRALGGFLVDPVDGGRTATRYLPSVAATLLVAVLAVLALPTARRASGLSDTRSQQLGTPRLRSATHAVPNVSRVTTTLLVDAP